MGHIVGDVGSHRPTSMRSNSPMTSEFEASSNARRTSPHRARRALRLFIGIAAAGTVLAAGIAPGVLAQVVQPQPQTSVVTTLPGTTTTTTTTTATTFGTTLPLTVSETEGPYFKTNSPERTSLVDDTTQGTLLTITGQVLT